MLPSWKENREADRDSRTNEQAYNVAVLSVPDFKSVQTVFKETRTHLGEILSAFEFFDHEGLEMVLEHTGAQSPFESQPEEGAEKPFYVLIETSGSNKDHDDEVSKAIFRMTTLVSQHAL